MSRKQVGSSDKPCRDAGERELKRALSDKDATIGSERTSLTQIAN